MFSQDFKELLSAFNEHHVKYLIVGGYAVAVRAQPRATKDLDIFVQPELANPRAIFAALAKFVAPLRDLKPDDLIDPNAFFRMGTAPQMIEILTKISGVNFDEAWVRRIEEVIDEQTGLKAFVISAEDFITNKLATARPQDIADVTAVRRAFELGPRRTDKSQPTGKENGGPQYNALRLCASLTRRPKRRYATHRPEKRRLQNNPHRQIAGRDH